MSVPQSQLQREAGQFLPAVVAQHARRIPDAPALVCGTRRYSYAELDAAANRLAHRLRALGAGAGEIVGISLERRADAVLALLTRLAARRHGPAAVLRALSRAERAPATIAAI